MNFLTIIENVPTELAKYPQWVSWSGTLAENGKTRKIPISPKSGRFAHTNASGTWGTFEEAVDFSREHNLPGIGFVLTENDDFVGIDFDDCFDPASGAVDPDVSGNHHSPGQLHRDQPIWPWYPRYCQGEIA